MLKILIAVDEPDFADSIVRMVCRVLDKTRLEVHLINVLETNLAESEYFLRNPEAYLRRKAQASKILDLEDYLLIQHVKYKATHLKKGIAADEIVKFASEENFDLAVVGTHNKHKIERMLLGSTSYNVVKKCPCSVLVVNPLQVPHKEDETSILFGTDGSDFSAFAAEKLSSLVNKENASVSVINAWYHSDLLALKNLSEFLDIVKLAEALQAQSFKLINTAVDIFRKNNVKTDKKISKEGHPSHVILDILKNGKFDIVALGSHGKSNLEQFFLGSVSNVVYENSQIATLILKKGNN